MALTDKQQAYMVFVSQILIALGAVSIPAGSPPVLTLILFISGALGMAIKEALGSVSQQGTPPPPPTPAPPEAPKTPPPIAQPAPYLSYMDEIAQVKAAGFFVFRNDSQPHGYVYRFVGIWYNAFGVILSRDISTIPSGTGSPL